MRLKSQFALLIFALCCCFPRTSDAYPVGPALSLEKLTEEADIIFKVVAIESAPVEEGSLKETPGFKPYLTKLRVVEIYKGKCDGDTASFHHYSIDPKSPGFSYMPQHYEFTKSRAYLLFAKQTTQRNVFQQLWQNHKSKEDQGLVLAASEKKHGGLSVKDVIWTELTALLKCRDAKDVMYAIGQLDWMTGGNDSDPQVAAAAALSLVSFSLDVARMTLESNVDHPEFRSVFVNTLASKDATHYVDQLADVVRNDLRPKHWWGGHIPWGVSWGILFKHLQKQPAAELRSGKFDDALDALESPKYYSSSEPRDLYALYLQRDMKERAKKFRAACKKRITYNIDYYFDMVDKSPNTYQRR